MLGLGLPAGSEWIIIFLIGGVPLVFIIVIAFLVSRLFSGKQLVDRETRCRRCGAILRGLKEPRCPACGEVI